MRTTSTLSYVAAIAVVLGACAAALANFDIPWRTIDGGGGTSAGGAFALSGTIGQPDPGPVMSGGAFTLTGGFWAIPAGPPDCPGDLDGDLDVDQADLGILLAAYNQNGDGDLDGDGDTDQADLGILLGNYGADC